jgi:hypothetical protein
MNDLKLPQKGFTKAERAWLQELINAINTVKAIAGANVNITNDPTGQIINASDCPPCP